VANHVKMTPEKEAQFCKVVEESGNVSKAARIIGMSRGYMYQYAAQPENKAFADAWQEADDTFVDLDEEELARRARGWNEERIDPKTGDVHSIRKYSDVCLIFRMKSKRPQIYNRELYKQNNVLLTTSSDSDVKLDGEAVNQALREMAIVKAKSESKDSKIN